MSLKEIYGQLIKNTIKDQLTLEATSVKSELMAGILNLIPGKELSINPVKIQLSEDDNQLTINGDLDFQWQILGIDAFRIDIKQLNWEFTRLEDRITSNLKLGGVVAISGSECTVSLTITPENRALAVIQKLENISFEQIAGLFLSNAVIPDSVKAFLNRSKSPLKEVDICYDPLTQENVEITLILAAGLFSVIPNKLEITKAEAVLQLVKFHGENPPSPDLISFQIQTDIKLNNKPLQGVISLQTNHLVLSVENENDTLSIKNIAGLFGASASADSFVSELEQIGLKNICISKTTFYLDADTRKLTGCDIAGSIILGNLKSNLSLSLPGWDYSGDLTQWQSESRPTEDISLQTLLQELAISTIAFPDLSIHSFVFSGSVGRHFLFSAEVVGHWELLDGALSLSDITLEFSRDSGQSASYGFSLKSFMTLGGVKFFVAGAYTGENDGWAFEGGTTDASPISVRNFANDCTQAFHLLSPPPFPDINIRNLNTSFQTKTGNIHFSAELDTKITLPFLSDPDNNKFDTSLKIDLIHDSDTGEKELNWSVFNNIMLNDSLFRLVYSEVEGDFHFSFVWQKKSPNDSLSLTGLFSLFGIDIKPFVSFEFSASELCFEYRVSSQEIILNGKTKDGANTFFIASRSGLSRDVQPQGTSQWEYIFGYQFKGHNKLSQIPVLGDSFKKADNIIVKESGLILSSVTIKNFVIPPLPSLTGEQSSDTGTGVKLNILKGLSAMAVVDFSQKQSKQMDFIRGCIGKTQLTIAASLDTHGDFSIDASLQGGLAFKVSESEVLALENPYMGIEFKEADPSYNFGGDIEIVCDQHVFTVTPSFTVGAEKSQGSATLKIAEEGLPGLFGLKGLYLDEATIGIGILTAPVPAVEIDLQGKAHIVKEEKAANQFAIVINIVEEVLTPRLFLISIQELSVASAIKMVTGIEDTDSLPDLVNKIKLTDVLYYWADAITIMPDNSVAQPGIRFNGNLEILNFKAHGDFAVGLAGISGMFEMSPIHFGKICSITGKGKGVSIKTIDGKRVYTANAGDTETQVVPPGGPVGAFNAIHSPFLSVSILVSLFDLVNCEVEAEIGLTGMKFSLLLDVSDTAKAELEMTLDRNGFYAHSDFQLHIKTDLGPFIIETLDFGTIHLETDIDLSMTLAVGDHFILELNGDFEFEGVSLHMPKLSINQPLPSLKDLSTYVIDHLKDNFKEIFKEVFDFGTSVFGEAKKEILQIEKATTEEIKDLQDKIDTGTQEIVSGAIQATRMLEESVNKTKNDINNIKNKIEDTQKAADEAVEKIAAIAAQKTEEIANEITHTEELATSELKKIDKAIENETAIVKNQVAALLIDANDEVSQIMDQSQKVMTQLIDDATKSAQAVVDEAKNVAAAINKQAQHLWNEAKELAQKALDEAKKLAEKAGDLIKKGWHSIFG